MLVIISLIVSMFIVYSITFFCILKIKKSDHLKYETFPRLRVKRSGLLFTSTRTHRIKINNTKIVQIGKMVYINFTNKLVIVSNIKDLKIYEGYMYFTGLGQVKISVDLKEVYRYFAIDIKSKQFSLEDLRQEAIVDLVNNNFDINFCKNTKKYIKIIEKVLNICIFQEKIIIKPNRFKLSFELKYKLNNQIKHVIVGETF